MKLTVQKRLAGIVMKCSPKRVKFVADRLPDIKEAITKADIAGLISEGLISKIQKKGVSRVRANHRANQRKKGLQRGPGKRKGKKTSIVSKKESWMAKIRAQRSLILELRDKEIIDAVAFKNLYRKAEGGFFRNKRHIKIYMQDHELVKKGN